MLRAVRVNQAAGVSYIWTRQELEASAKELFDMVTSGKLRVNVNERFALKDATEAHRAIESRATTGSAILAIRPSAL